MLGKGKEVGRETEKNSRLESVRMGSEGSLLYEVLVKEFFNLEHRIRGFFHPSRAERPCV